MSSFVGRAVDAASSMMSQKDHPRADEAAKVITAEAKLDSSRSMKAVTWQSNSTVKVSDCSVPQVTDPKDAIIRITSTAICGSDLHLYLGCVAGMKSGQILGHEPMGIVEDIGPNVQNVKKGDRVVVSFCIACGTCYYCKRELFSACDMTNPVPVIEKLYGSRTAGLFGHPQQLGGFAGGQAEYLRVPFADVNCLVLPPENELSDDRVLFLSDILPTAWYGNELAQVGRDDIVAIFGAGPVGILAAQCAFARGARRVIMVDKIQYRLEFAKKQIPRIEMVDSSSGNDAGETQVLALCRDEPAGAPDCVIECVGMHYAHSYVHKFEMATGLETDSPEALNAAIVATRKGGHLAIIGAYAGFANHVNVGALMEKGLRVGSGQTPVQRYWRDLLERIKRKELDPSIVVTHHMPIEDADKAYQIFNDKQDNSIKIVLNPSSTRRVGK
jgi:threonine dehydrogenase-like Zn-dependent dehydrogenase